MSEIRCTICADSRSPEMVATYIRSRSLRQTAAAFGVGYKSLERHLTDCVSRMFSDFQEEQFQHKLKESVNLVHIVCQRRYNAPRLDMRVPRPKSIITKDVKFSWSRRSWKDKKKAVDGVETVKKAK